MDVLDQLPGAGPNFPDYDPDVADPVADFSNRLRNKPPLDDDVEEVDPDGSGSD